MWAGTGLVWHKGGAGEEITEPVMGKNLDSEKKIYTAKKKSLQKLDTYKVMSIYFCQRVLRTCL